MSDQHYRVQVEGDHIRKVAIARPLQAVAELIWNAVDADATTIAVEITSDDIAMRSVSIRDNGHGIPHSEVEALFGKLGGSWKAHKNRSKIKGRILHGKEGKSRFKALALGRVADWVVRYCESGKLLRYKITVTRDDLVDVQVTEPEEVDSALGPGVDLLVTELDRTYRSLDPQVSVQSLSEIFALYLTDYAEVGIFVEGNRLDPSELIAGRTPFKLSPILDNGKEHAVQVEVIEWLSASERWFFLCGAEGFPFERLTPNLPTPGFQFSAYLKSTFVSALQEQSALGLPEMVPPFKAAYIEASEVINEYLDSKAVESAQSVKQWKADDIYPYRSEALTAVEKAERQVFDIVALNVHKHLREFAEQSRRTMHSSDNNTWIFGDEFNLTVDDQSLTEVLRKHRKLNQNGSSPGSAGGQQKFDVSGDPSTKLLIVSRQAHERKFDRWTSMRV